VCSFVSGLATSIAMLAAARFVLGLGMGGEWNTGATLVAESWPTEVRAQAISVVQSSWAFGFAAAALVAGPVARYFGWRAVFFVGILPALLTLWIRRRVPESAMWQQNLRGIRNTALKGHGNASKEAPLNASPDFSAMFQRPYLKPTFALLFFNFFCLFAWWGLFTWMPPYLSLPVSQGGRGFGAMGTTTLLVVLNLFGMLPGYLSFGWVADHLGRRKACFIDSVDGAGDRGGVVRDGCFLRFRNYGKRDFSNQLARPSVGIHLQRRPRDELCCAAGDWGGRSDERFERGILFVRGRISAGGVDDNATTRDSRERAGMR